MGDAPYSDGYSDEEPSDPIDEFIARISDSPGPRPISRDGQILSPVLSVDVALSILSHADPSMQNPASAFTPPEHKLVGLAVRAVNMIHDLKEVLERKNKSILQMFALLHPEGAKPRFMPDTNVMFYNSQTEKLEVGVVSGVSISNGFYVYDIEHGSSIVSGVMETTMRIPEEPAKNGGIVDGIGEMLVKTALSNRTVVNSGVPQTIVDMLRKMKDELIKEPKKDEEKPDEQA